jgi:hypothetical protein
MLKSDIHTRPYKFFRAVSNGEIRWLIPNIIFYSFGDITVLSATYFLYPYVAHTQKQHRKHSNCENVRLPSDVFLFAKI